MIIKGTIKVGAPIVGRKFDTGKLFFSGDYYEVGRQLGALYKANRKSFSKVKVDEALLKKQLVIYQKHYPDFITELKGIAQGGSFDEKKVLYQFLSGPISWTLDQKIAPWFTECSIFGVQTKNGLLIGRNYDWHPVSEKIFQVYKINLLGKIPYSAVSDMYIRDGRDLNCKHHYYLPIDAINQAGLYIGLTAIRNYNWSYGLSSVHMIKLIAENCRTVAEAMAVFKKTPLNCAKNFFIGDRSGKMVVVEHLSGVNFKVLYPQNGILIKTNHFLSPEFIKEDKIKSTSTSFLRYYEILKGIGERQDSFSQADIINILGNRASYALQNTAKVRTIWSLSLNLSRKDYRLYYNLFGRRKSLKLKV